MKIDKRIGKRKGTIVFIHGSSSSPRVFKEVMESSEIECTRITVELPGHGQNTSNEFKEEDFSFASYCKKLIAAINLFDDDILLVGNSLGGHLAIEIAPKVKRIRGLVIFGTPPAKKPINFDEAFLPVPALQTFFTENPSEIDIELAAEIAVYDKINAKSIKEDFKQANPLVRKNIAFDILNGKFSDQFKIFTTLKVPKFIIAGVNDPTVNPKYLVDVQKKCKTSCEIIKFKNCGHYPSLEKPEEFIETLKEIISKVF